MKKYVLIVVFVFFSLGDVHAEFVELIKLNSHIKLDIRYATPNNFTKKQVYPNARCFLLKDAALTIDAIQKELEKEGLGLKIFDGYRPLAIQKIFWALCPDDRYVANPAKGSKHNRGAAVDLTLIDLKTGKELEMPSGYDDFSEKAYRLYGKMPPLVAANCKKLEEIMIKYGWIPWPSEWWHFDFVGYEKNSVLDISFEEIDAQKV